MTWLVLLLLMMADGSLGKLMRGYLKREDLWPYILRFIFEMAAPLTICI